LLNECLKEHRKVEEMQNAIDLTAQLQQRAAQIQKVRAQLQLTKSTPD